MKMKCRCQNETVNISKLIFKLLIWQSYFLIPKEEKVIHCKKPLTKYLNLSRDVNSEKFLRKMDFQRQIRNISNASEKIFNKEISVTENRLGVTFLIRVFSKVFLSNHLDFLMISQKTHHSANNFYLFSLRILFKISKSLLSSWHFLVPHVHRDKHKSYQNDEDYCHNQNEDRDLMASAAYSFGFFQSSSRVVKGNNCGKTKDKRVWNIGKAERFVTCEVCCGLWTGNWNSVNFLVVSAADRREDFIVSSRDVSDVCEHLWSVLVNWIVVLFIIDDIICVVVWL